MVLSLCTSHTAAFPDHLSDVFLEACLLPWTLKLNLSSTYFSTSSSTSALAVLVSLSFQLGTSFVHNMEMQNALTSESWHNLLIIILSWISILEQLKGSVSQVVLALLQCLYLHTAWSQAYENLRLRNWVPAVINHYSLGKVHRIICVHCDI